MILLAAAVATGTLELRAAPLAEALPRIGRTFGVTMRAAPSIGEEIVVARFDRTSLTEVKTRIARTFAAEWRTEPDGTLVLGASAERRRAERDAWFRARRERFARHFAALRREVAGLEVLDAAAAIRLRARVQQASNASESSPSIEETLGRRLLLRLVAGLRDEALISEGASGEAVFSLTPTEFQRALAPDARDAFRLYREERALMDALDEEAEDGDDASPPTRLLLKTLVEGSVFQAELNRYDESGFGETIAQEVISGEDGRPRREARPVFPFRLGPNGPSDPRAFLTTEPLAFAASDALLSAARLADRSVVVAPSDRLFLAEPPESAEGDDLATWLDSEEADVRLDGEDWMEIATDHPYVVRSTFYPRRRMRMAIGVRSKGDPTLRDQLALVRARPETSSELPGDTLLRTAFPGLLSGNLASLRLAAALSSSEWARAEQGPIAFVSLAPTTRRLAIEALARSDSPSDPELRNVVIACRFGPPWWEEEPTNRSVSIANATLRLRTRTVRLIELRQKGVPLLLPPAVAERLSEVLDALSARLPPEEDPRKELGIETDRLRLFTRREWDLLFGDPRDVAQGATIEDAPVLVDAGPYSLDRLPPAFRR